MKSRILKFLNPVGILMISWIALAAQSTLFNSSWLQFFQPDFLLLMTLWLAMKRRFFEGGILVLLLGNSAETHSGAPRGTFLTLYMAVYLIGRTFYKNFQISNTKSLMVTGAALGFFSKIFILLFLVGIGKSETQWFYTAQLLAPAIVTHALIIPITFKTLYRFDFFTLKAPEAEHRFERDFYIEEDYL